MGGGYEVLIARDVADWLDRLDEQSKRIVNDTLANLEQPSPGRGLGDTERITWRGDDVFRLRIGRTWTAFYDIDDEQAVVRVREILPIDDAHKEYGV